MPITGDFRQLDAFISELLELADGSFRREVNLRLSEAARTLVADGFEKGIDPAGNRWAPLKRRAGQPLLDTGRLRNSFGPEAVSSRSFTLGTDVVYSGVHQGGAQVRHGARVAPRNRRGRFLSLAAASRRTAKSTTLAFLPAHTATIPRRQMVPEGEIPPRWWRVFESEADALMRGAFGD